MPRYQSTTKQRYMWGMGVVCSLLLLASVGMWALDGKVGIRMRGLNGEAIAEVRRADSPVLFWVIVGSLLAGGVGSVVFTGSKLAKLQRADEPKA